MNTLEKIKDIENEIARTQKNKATANHLGILKAKIAKLRRELLAPSQSTSSEAGFDVAKTGVARIGFIGFPSVGKSTLMSALTGTHSAVAEYEFTTLTTVPGVLTYRGARLQLLDLPGIIEGAKDGRGRGKQVLGVARSCSLLLVVLDASRPLTHKRVIDRELDAFGIRTNKSPPRVRITRTERGGLSLHNESSLEYSLVKSILAEYRISSADVVIQGECTVDELIDAVEGNRKYVPCLYVLNKIDKLSVEELDVLCRVPCAVPVCADRGWNFDGLLAKCWARLQLVRVYPKPRGQGVDYSEPVVLREERKRVLDFCNAIHRGIAAKFRYALVWGSSVKHNPQKVGKEHVLNDGDVVQIVKSV